MTTIVYRGGVMAADSRAYGGYNVSLGSKIKIRRLPDGTLVGCSSTQPGLGEAIVEWYARGARPVAAPNKGDGKFSLLVVRPDGTALYANDGFYLSGPLAAPFFAIGSGEGPAMGAMHAGCSAKQAVEIACKVDVWSEPPIVTLTHGLPARGRRRT
jgi:20S proteasome alpha/beta subunit